MFKGMVLGIMYYTWKSYKNAWNDAVIKGLLIDTKGNKITKIYQD